MEQQRHQGAKIVQLESMLIKSRTLLKPTAKTVPREDMLTLSELLSTKIANCVP
jgi:hypothetical protein